MSPCSAMSEAGCSSVPLWARYARPIKRSAVRHFPRVSPYMNLHDKEMLEKSLKTNQKSTNCHRQLLSQFTTYLRASAKKNRASSQLFGALCAFWKAPDALTPELGLPSGRPPIPHAVILLEKKYTATDAPTAATPTPASFTGKETTGST